jgi:hypothetical protein
VPLREQQLHLQREPHRHSTVLHGIILCGLRVIVVLRSNNRVFLGKLFELLRNLLG